MNHDRERSGNRQGVIFIIGTIAIILAVVLLIAFLPKEPEVDPYVIQLEQEVSAYTAQLDSLNAVVDGLNGRLDRIRSRMDSVQASNRTVLASLHRVTNEMKEYQRLYRKQQAVSRKLRQELTQVRTEKERAVAEARHLKSEVDSLNNELYEKTVRLVRLEDNLEQAVRRAKSLEATVRSVLVYVGTEDVLKQEGYLKMGRSVLLKKRYRLVGFPRVAGDQEDAAVFRTALGEPLLIPGPVAFLVDRHGKLSKRKREYTLRAGPQGHPVITFVDSTLSGQRVLVVLENAE